MTQKKRNHGNLSNSEQNGNPPVPNELTLREEGLFLIQLIFEEFEEIIINYPHHAAYCLASITRLVDTAENLPQFARRLGMWLWIEVLAFQTEEPLDLTELAEHFEIDREAIQTGIDDLVNAEEFGIEWEREGHIKLVPRMLKETVIHFAEQVLSGIEAGEQEEGVES
ncbi:SMC-Scp complex subunit ScpB [Candidatus Poribacteria bacterium]|nr:SMC-Scp complex subunit ScpB [Candidatus Poribacteria bacterium]